MEPFTVTLTSCGRFDLLERTLRSLLPRLDGPVKAVLIAEDSGDYDIHGVIRQFVDSDVPLKAIVNPQPIGQIASIDRLYDLVETDWVFHCEDDWEFFGTGFIKNSFDILQENEHFSMVGLRDHSEYIDLKIGPERVSTSGIRYRVLDGLHPWRDRYAGLHFNPGLRRMTDYRLIGPYSELGRDVNEATVSEAYLNLGYRVAMLAEPAVRHIGGERHIRDPFRPSRRFPYRIKRSTQKRWRMLQYRVGHTSHSNVVTGLKIPSRLRRILQTVNILGKN